ILLNGATYSKWLNKVSLPRRKLVNTSQSFKDQYIEVKDLTTHRHGPQGAHAHAGKAFTTWIDFQLAIQQTEAVHAALERLVPEQKKQFETNFSRLKDDLLALDRRIKEIVTNDRGQPLVASHPVYDYFARRYGLNIRSVFWEPDDVPSATQWRELEAILKDYPAEWMIWEGTPNPDSVDKLKSMEVKSLVFDPCGNVPDQGDFLSIMKQNVENLGIAFQ
ncbi:MAG: metal ABC transporter substrate-binding protein, partial [Gammaproteobacteria bacterium]